MTDDETERTGELFKSLAGKHSLVVVEHDMAFIVASSAARSPCCTKARCWPRDLATVQNDQRVIEVYRYANA
jgi:urea transport system ATP-binding protein